MGGDEQFVNGLADWHRIIDDEYTWHRQTGIDPGSGEWGNCFAVVCEENQPPFGRPLKYRRVLRRCQADLSNMCEFQSHISPSQAVHDVLVEVLIDQKRDHGISPFALARARRSSLVGPGGCDASI